MPQTIPLLDFIGDLAPTECKLHCAVWNGEAHPADVLANTWDEWVGWNSWRNARNDFNRQFIFSLAQSRTNPAEWLFGGVFEVLARRPEPGRSYDVTYRPDILGPLVKRLVVSFRLSGRTVRLNLETHLAGMSVAAVLPEEYSGEQFPGLDQINHSFAELEVVVNQRRPDWESALQHMKGVYVIHDQATGKPYVGAAYGDTGIWARLCQYAASLHGGNAGLRELVGQKGTEYARQNLRYSLLEFWSMRTPDEHVLQRESYWKEVLMSREFGNNRN